MKKITLIAMLCFFSFPIASQAQELWKPINKNENNILRTDLYTRNSVPSEYKLFSLNLENFKQEVMSLRNRSITITLPSVSGELEKYKLKIASSLSPELSAKYPMIQSFIATGIDNPKSTARISIGTDGLYVSIFKAGEETLYIDPYAKNNKEYIVYGRNAIERTDDFECLVEGQSNQTTTTTVGRNADDGKLRTYRTAIACTAEYAQFQLTNQGVDMFADLAVRKAAVMSAMNTVVTRINSVYEREIGVRLELVSNNDELIYFSAATDPFTSGNDGAVLGESQVTIDNVIGNANYDIGHTFDASGDSGVAALGSVCVAGSKASAMTGRLSPLGDPFVIDYVAHEMGHQFGANHTQNNSCQRNSGTAVENGSGVTIMGYAGICAPNVANNSIDIFHAVNIDEMWAHIQGAGNCADATATNTGNAAPTADAGPDYVVPRSTPLVLKGTATDADGLGSLTYTWEQTDTEIATQPPLATNTGGPNFRCFLPSTSPDRYLPMLSTLLAGNTSSTWEVLPSTLRDMNFAFVVRDNNPGGGSSARDDMKVSVNFAGPFVVTSQPTGVTWTANSSATITWDVASTDGAPINCTEVNIKFSTDGGLTYPITILSNTPNDGTQEITVPNVNTTTGRIMVEAANNIFFNINGGVIQIENATASVDDFNFNNFALYPNPSNGEFNLSFEVENTDEVTTELYDIRGRKVGKQVFKNISTQFSEKLTFDNVSTGIYLLKISNAGKQSTRKIIIK